MKYLVVDGQLNGTGIREVDGDYISLEELCLDDSLQIKIKEWLLQYEYLYYSGFKDADKMERLDKQGLEIVCTLQKIFPEYKIEYYSNALCCKIFI
jgi:hypothetical protein